MSVAGGALIYARARRATVAAPGPPDARKAVIESGEIVIPKVRSGPAVEQDGALAMFIYIQSLGAMNPKCAQPPRAVLARDIHARGPHVGGCAHFGFTAPRVIVCI